MTEEKSRKGSHKIATVVILAVLIIASLTIAFGAGKQTEKLVSIGTAGTLVPTGVNTTLNVTFSDLSYITQPPQFMVSEGQYTVGNATYLKNTGSQFTNDTYMIFNNTATSAVTGINYNVSKDKGTTNYFFTEARLAYNGTTTGAEYYSVSHKPVAKTGVTSIINVNGTKFIYLKLAPASSGKWATPTLYVNGTSKTVGANVNVATTGPVNHNGFNGTLSPLKFYLFSIYANKTHVSAAIFNTGNGTELWNNTANLNSGNATVYQDLNNTALTYSGIASAPQDAFIFDWMYVATHNTYSSSSAAIQTSAVNSGLAPMVTGASQFVNSGSSVAPFDPSSHQNTTYAQSPNATAVHVNTNVGGSDFSAVSGSNNTTTLHAIKLNTTYRVSNFKNNHSLNSTQGFQTIASLEQTNSIVNANIHVSVWNSSGINAAIMSFLKNYSAIAATVSTGILTNYTEITITGYAIGSIQLATNMSKSDASAVRNYMDNNMAGVMKANNLSLVDTNTTAIVAGAFAGDFYANGMAIVPSISANGQIVNPWTGQTFANLTDAGFAAGAYISGGVVVVPQVTILGWADGTPIYASGFSFGSLFGGLSSAGSSVANWFGNGASSISNGIGSAVKTATNYVVKPVSSTVSSTSSALTNDFNGFSSQISKLTNDIMPTVGALPGDIRSSVSSALGPVAGAVSKVSSELGSYKQGLVTSIASGYSGIRTDVMTLGNSTSQSIASLQNTLGSKISQSQAVLSKMFTAVSNIPGMIHTDVTSLAAGFYNASKANFETLMNTAGSYYSGLTSKYLNYTQSVLGGISSKISSGIGSIQQSAGSAWSMIVSFGAKLGYVLEIVGITIAIVVIVGLVLYIYFRKQGTSGVPGETSI